MAHRTAWVTLITTLMLLNAGCGTVGNVVSDAPPKPYGGVLRDCEKIAGLGEPQRNPNAPGLLGDTLLLRSLDSAGTFLLVAIDLPLSVIGDTLTLPYTLNYPDPRMLPPAQRTNPPTDTSAPDDLNRTHLTPPARTPP
jgi:uncharacterized protein YceK